MKPEDPEFKIKKNCKSKITDLTQEEALHVIGPNAAAPKTTDANTKDELQEITGAFGDKV